VPLPVSVGEAAFEVDVEVAADTMVDKVVGTELNVLAEDAGAELGTAELGAAEFGIAEVREAVEGAAVDGAADD
jgi:hypothetical protein